MYKSNKEVLTGSQRLFLIQPLQSRRQTTNMHQTPKEEKRKEEKQYPNGYCCNSPTCSWNNNNNSNTSNLQLQRQQLKLETDKRLYQKEMQPCLYDYDCLSLSSSKNENGLKLFLLLYARDFLYPGSKPFLNSSCQSYSFQLTQFHH